MLRHPAVAECAVVGAPGCRAQARSSRPSSSCTRASRGDAALARALQDHVKAEIAPYKYPRAIEFRAELPKTQAASCSVRSCGRRRRRRGDPRRVERACGPQAPPNFSLVESGLFKRLELRSTQKFRSLGKNVTPRAGSCESRHHSAESCRRPEIILEFRKTCQSLAEVGWLPPCPRRSRGIGFR